ncbi:hypothetical protein FH608_046420 [Nonomuraea phyllanthi]|uniref:Uncharacterized protein n=1 Tax=Nonomuraea phyllanthi TaxID=2219224 RepID=A0A5C4V8V4_9ACTN|nr:hypothetical protein [Nonomuraea phyllanthi]KAB8186928.1 hypothetical protein FH608_046420 [Nonomuraea phyllanthi]
MSDPMAPLDAAYAEVQRAEKLAEEIVNGAWLEFGRAIREARASGVKQADIARHFEREPEHIRRIQEDADVVDGIKPPPARKTRPVAHVTLRDLEAAGFRLTDSPEPSDS